MTVLEFLNRANKYRLKNPNNDIYDFINSNINDYREIDTFEKEFAIKKLVQRFGITFSYEDVKLYADLK